MKTLRHSSVIAVLLVLSGGASAQFGSSYEAGRSAWRPSVEVSSGVLLDRPSYRLDCLGPCEQPRGTGSIAVANMFTPYVGAQFGTLSLGEADRAGGDVRAEGFNFSLLGRAPVFGGLGIYGRLGTTWGRTQVRTGGAGLAVGRASGWGPAYGLGLDWAFADRWSAVLDWQRHRLDFAGDDASWIRSTSVGLKYRF